LVEHNPLALAIIGLGIGFAVSTMMPEVKIPNSPVKRPDLRNSSKRRGAGAA
jgi:uncharacterized membrane protein YgaE (UPF0421/DUF939 family)